MARASTADDLAIPYRRLHRADLPDGTVELARYLIDKVLVHESPSGTTAGRIVETEAYPVGDAASHAYRGPTTRNRSMYLERGHAYVYQIHGRFCLNVASEREGIGAAVLVRALEPLLGLDHMARRRGTERVRDLVRGPGRLAEAMGIDRRHDGCDLCSDALLWLASTDREPGAVATSVRIGLTREIDRPLRFFEPASPFLSGTRRLNTAPE